MHVPIESWRSKEMQTAIPFFVSMATLATASVGSTRGPPIVPTVGAATSGVYRNMFVEAGYSASEVDDRVNATIQQLLFGNPQNESLLYPAADGSKASYIWDVGDNDVRTEGMSYGLMAAVQLNLHEVFDRILSWWKRFMQHTQESDPRFGYSSWHCQTSGNSMDDNPASDGETFYVTALLFASQRWGDSGAWNYSAEAQLVLRAMLGKEAPPCGPEGCQSVVNMFGGYADVQPPLVVFVPYASAASYTDPSYVTPAFYEVWAAATAGWGGNTSAFWLQAAAAARAFHLTTPNPTTGLTPDYSTFSGQPTGGGQTFSFDAWRSVRNVATDVAWYAPDNEHQVAQCNRVLTFFRGLSTWPNYGNQFDLDGTQIDGDHSPGLVAMNAVASLGSNLSIAWDFVDALWNTSVPSGQWRYYDGVLYLEAFLQLSGRYRANAWDLPDSV